MSSSNIMADAPCNLMAPRRSGRTIEKLCNGVQINTLDSDGDIVTLNRWYTGLLLALAHCSGWTADHIALEIKNVTGKEFTAEDIWSFNRRWVLDRGIQVELSREDFQAMLWVLKQEGFMLPEIGRPLHKTEQPISGPFCKLWTPSNPDGPSLYKGYHSTKRQEIKEYLYSKQLSHVSRFAPMEEALTIQLGSTVQRLMKETIKKWFVSIKVMVKETPCFRELNTRDAVVLIMEHLQDYHYKYEAIFGVMEETTTFGKINGGAVHVQSTGYGVKLLLGLMLADRIHVIDRFLRLERERICFEQVDSSDLPIDSKNCCVCQDPLDIETPEGTSEQGLKLIICCRQVIGENCLKEWLSRSGPAIRKNCPNCRYDFPMCFLVKLFGEGYSMEEDEEEEELDMANTIVVEQPRGVVDLVSPSPEQSPEPEPARAERSPAPSPAPSPLMSIPSPSPSPVVLPMPMPAEWPAGWGPAVGPADMLGSVFTNTVHTHIPQGADDMPDFAAAWSYVVPQRADDFMMEG
ncbi:hypothetical protein N431DRAFT_411916 [Stipitochalara longipes BDJ]|nr:hypothetical protein N431DRAFT_411916 [Stipitochalara longipes BDJ]